MYPRADTYLKVTREGVYYTSRETQTRGRERYYPHTPHSPPWVLIRYSLNQKPERTPFENKILEGSGDVTGASPQATLGPQQHYNNATLGTQSEKDIHRQEWE